jgi:chorismate-pyruvate lyase
MNLTTPQFDACKNPEEALSLLGAEVRVRRVEPDEMPVITRALLVHHGHMTEVLGRHYHGKVELTVLESQLVEGSYWRKILLHVNGQLAEYGVVRIFLQYVSKEAADEILERKLPLGAVLIKHNILRSVEPKWYVKISPAEIKNFFGGEPDKEHYFGRIGVIHCNGEPAIELFEVVTE